MKRLFVLLVCIAALGLAAPAAATEIIREETEVIIGSGCFDEWISATGTVTIVTNDVASVVTFGGATAVGQDTGDTYQFNFGFMASFPPKQFITGAIQNRLVISDPDGNKLIAHTISHFSLVNGGPRIDIEIQKSRCVEV
jgi:hypothetical protein